MSTKKSPKPQDNAALKATMLPLGLALFAFIFYKWSQSSIGPNIPVPNVEIGLFDMYYTIVDLLWIASSVTAFRNVKRLQGKYRTFNAILGVATLLVVLFNIVLVYVFVVGFSGPHGFGG